MPHIGMRRFQASFFKPFAANDQRQIPATGSSVSVLKQGATVKTTTILYEGISNPVEVIDVGGLAVGDVVQIGLDDSQTFTVGSVDLSATVVGIESSYSGQVVLVAGTRIVAISPGAQLYSDSAGTWPITGSVVAVDANGSCAFYCRSTRFDYILAGGGISSRLYLDGEGGWAHGGLSWINGRDYPNLQDAVNACPTGGTVFIPAGDYRVPSGGLVLSRTVTLLGETGTRLLAHSVAVNQPVIKLVPGGQVLQNIELRSLLLTNDSRPSSRLTGHHGIVCDVPEDGSKVAGLVLDRVAIYNMGDDGIKLTAYGGTTDSFFVFVSLRRVDVTLSRGHGLFVQVATMVSFTDSYFNSNDGCGVRADKSEVSFRSTAFEDNCLGSWVDSTYDGQVRLRTCFASHFDACHWENFATAAHVSKRGLVIENSPGCTVSNSLFTNPPVGDPNAPPFTDPQDASVRGIFCTYGDGAGVQGSLFYGNTCLNLVTALEIDGTLHPALDCVVFPHHATAGSGAVILPYGASTKGLVGVNQRDVPTGTPNPPSAPPTVVPGRLHGVLIPTMANADLLGFNPATEVGRLVYDPTFQTLRFWDGSSWRVVTAT